MYYKDCHGKRKGGQTMLFPMVTQGKNELACGSYNEDNSRRELAFAIVMLDYPLSILALGDLWLPFNHCFQLLHETLQRKTY